MAQTLFEGKVIDCRTKQPVPFTSIRFKGTNKGTVANADGYFRFFTDTAVVKTLEFCSLGYEGLVISTRKPLRKQICLQPAAYTLGGVEVFATKYSASEMFLKAAQKGRDNKETYSPRSFFSLSTVMDGSVPVEVIEAFFQAGLSVKRGIAQLSFKNGRYGLTGSGNYYFMNLNSTHLLEKLPFFTGDHNLLPEHPLYLGKNEMEHGYRFSTDTTLWSDHEPITVISFRPVANDGRRFSGKIWINSRTFATVKLDLDIRNTSRQVLYPIHQEDSLWGLNLSYELSFRKNEPGGMVPERISLKYDFQYFSATGSHTFSTDIFLLFYDYDEPFELPLAEGTETLTDYAFMEAVPYSEYFWKRNYLVPATQLGKDYSAYFQKHGVVVNFDGSEIEDKDARSPLKKWSPERRLAWNDFMPYDANSDKTAAALKNTPYPLINPAERSRIVCRIFLDLNKEGDTCYFSTAALFDRSASYFNAPRDSSSLEYVKLVFDLAEAYRRSLDRQLCKTIPGSCNQVKIQEMYWKTLKDYDHERFKLGLEVKKGQDAAGLARWRSDIDKRLTAED